MQGTGVLRDRINTTKTGTTTSTAGLLLHAEARGPVPLVVELVLQEEEPEDDREDHQIEPSWITKPHKWRLSNPVQLVLDTN